MKYLCIHKIIWFLLIIFWTLFEFIIICIHYILYILWNFKFPKQLWEKWHTYSYLDIDNKQCPPSIVPKIKSDKTIFETIKRRYKISYELTMI